MTSSIDARLWRKTCAARAALASDLTYLDEQQWRTQSLCADWDVEQVAAHLTAAASLGRLRWLRSMVGAAFRPSVHNDRRLREQLGATPAKTLERFQGVLHSTTAPSQDTAAYLGEVLVHSQDIRAPLGIDTETDLDALTDVANFFARRNFTVPSKSLVRGLRLRATDGPFEFGDGPSVVGSTLALVMRMAGRDVYLDQLDGSGCSTVHQRLNPAATAR